MGRSVGNGFEGGYCTLGLLASFAVSHAQPAAFCEAGFDALAMFSLKKKASWLLRHSLTRIACREIRLLFRLYIEVLSLKFAIFLVQ